MSRTFILGSTSGVLGAHYVKLLLLHIDSVWNLCVTRRVISRSTHMGSLSHGRSNLAIEHTPPRPIYRIHTISAAENQNDLTRNY